MGPAAPCAFGEYIWQHGGFGGRFCGHLHGGRFGSFHLHGCLSGHGTCTWRKTLESMAAAHLGKILPKTAQQLDTVGSTTTPRSQQPAPLSAHKANEIFTNTPRSELGTCGTTKSPGGAGWALTPALCPALQISPSWGVPDMLGAQSCHPMLWLTGWGAPTPSGPAWPGWGPAQAAPGRVPSTLEEPGVRVLTGTHLHSSLQAPGTACSGWSRHSPALGRALQTRQRGCTPSPQVQLCWAQPAPGRCIPETEWEKRQSPCCQDATGFWSPL